MSQQDRPSVPITRLAHNPDLPLPAYETEAAAGMDLRAAIPEDEPLILAPMARTAVPTGLAFALPLGFEGQIRSRSGLAIRHGITCLTGTIDADYRGELKVVLANLGESDFTIRRGDRIAQLIVAAVARANWEEVSELDATVRGSGGFGSTGS